MARYQILDELGRGWMGVVYRALEVDLGREVALKLIPAESIGNERFVQRFHREVRVLAALSHPNVVRIYDSGSMDGRPYYTMEVVPGKDLGELATAETTFPLSRALTLIVQAADALAYLHGQGVSHRDIKLKNMMVDRAGRLKLMDFGLAKAAQGEAVTKAGTVLGTPLYMAPEVLLGQGASFPADVYGLAICLHELVAGSPWLKARDFPQAMHHILTQPAPSLRAVKEPVPEALLEAQERALAKDPAPRAKASEYRDSLRSILVAMGGSGASLEAVVPDLAPPAAGDRQSAPEGRTRPEPSAAEDRLPAIGTIGIAIGFIVGAALTAFAVHTFTGPVPESTASAAGRPLVAPPVRTPSPAAVRAFLCLPTDVSVVVDFDGSSADLSRVELGLWGRQAPLFCVDRSPGETFFHRLFRNLKPDTDYFLRGTAPSGQTSLPDYRFRTESQEYGRDSHRLLLGLKSNPAEIGWLSEGLLSSPDPRVVPVVRRYVARMQLDYLDPLQRFSRLAAKLRDVELADDLVRFVDRVPEELRSEILAALGATRHPRAGELGLKHIRQATSLTDLEACAEALATAGGAETCATIALAVERAFERYSPVEGRPGTRRRRAPGGDGPIVWGGRIPTSLGASMVRADPTEARRRFAAWISRPDVNVALLANACRGLMEVGTDQDLPPVERFLGHDQRTEIREIAAELLASLGLPAARRLLLGAFQRQPEQRGLVGIMGRLAIVEAAPGLAALLAGPAGPAIRADAACSLGLVRSKQHVEDLARALSDASPEVRNAAAWALSWVADPRAVGPLLAMASSARDELGVAAWTLGNLEAPAIGELREQLRQLKGSDGKTEVRQAMIVWAVGRMAMVGQPGATEAMVEIRGVGADHARPPLAREVAKLVVRELGPTAGLEPDRTVERPPRSLPQVVGRFDLAPPIVPFTRPQIHVVLPFAPYHPTGIVLQQGESCDVSFLGGGWGFLSSGGACKPADQAQERSADGPELRLIAVVSHLRRRVERARYRVRAPRTGELLLSPYNPRAWFLDSSALKPAAGAAIVLIEK
ncbi:MAG: protein kinase [Candidatus Riflebacteria bacterium]|nr:protein kinase [Candidatus Riflebacteria bacterium]